MADLVADQDPPAARGVYQVEQAPDLLEDRALGIGGLLVLEEEVAHPQGQAVEYEGVVAIDGELHGNQVCLKHVPVYL
ncbi:MAG: hypothetical protein OXM57_09490 [bacterium]|nr:hypothetical protein [bacterium]MDE0352911.1 hypothetical protein [bacterium]